MSELKHFQTLNSVNVSKKIEKKKTGNVELSYLSWADAWAELKKEFPDANYEIIKFNGLPYIYDPQTGYMVFTKVTIENITHEMFLPVMDGANKAMKAESYEYVTKFGKKSVEAATMFDINKTIMRCLVKNIAMFGLGLSIYRGEDFPEESTIKEKPKEIQQNIISAKSKEHLDRGCITIEGCRNTIERIEKSDNSFYQQNPLQRQLQIEYCKEKLKVLEGN